MNILFFQTGHYADAYTRMKAGEPETYRDQNASVAFVESLSADHNVTTLAMCDDVHDIALTPRLRSIGRPRGQLGTTDIKTLLDDLAPDRIICRSPYFPVLHQSRARAIPTLPCFADLFRAPRLRAKLRNLRLRWVLSGNHIPCVANHSLNASRSIIDDLHYPAARTVPWDWSRIDPEHAPKAQLADPDAPSAFYAGALSIDKGVGDCLDAIAFLHKRKSFLSMQFAGPGDIAMWQAKAKALGIAAYVDFLGVIPNTDVRRKMMDHDMVIVPSRHSYPEGLPNVIYEGLASRSPLILSDHPAFAGRIETDTGCLTFKASDPSALAANITRLCQDPALYRRLSENAPGTLDRLYLGMEWQTLVETFLDDPHNQRNWVTAASMAAQTS